ncbi:MAG: transposase [Ktedonobacterales bacterium]
MSRGFAVPALSAWCEQEGITYTIGLPTNARLEALAAPLLAQARQQHQQTGQKVRMAGETAYAADSWPRERWVIYKAEVLAKGPNTRFVVTTRPDPPLDLYNWYVQRGTSEQWIEDLKNGCFADRLSCHCFWANQFRLLLHAAAYWLLDTLRRWLMQAGLPRLQLGTLRLRLIKIGGWVREWVHGVALHLASSHPGEPLWRLLAARSTPT